MVISHCSAALSSLLYKLALSVSFGGGWYQMQGLRIYWAESPAAVIPLSQHAVVLNAVTSFCLCAAAACSQRALPWKLGHTDYMFWSVLMSVMQTENWKKSKGEKAGGASFSFCQDKICVVTDRRLGTLSGQFLAQLFLKGFIEAQKSKRDFL